MTALSAVLANAEAPALLKGLGDLLSTERDELPLLEKRRDDAQTELADQERCVADLRAALDAAPDLPASRAANYAARAALKHGEEALRYAEAHARISKLKLGDQVAVCMDLENKIRAVESLPQPDPVVIAALAALER